MNSVLRVNDDLMCRGRILHREWKLNKPVGLPLFVIRGLIPFYVDIDLVLAHLASRKVRFFARARAGPCVPSIIHLSTVWLLQRTYSSVSLVQVVISRGS
jgi:hypothetical protein